MITAEECRTYKEFVDLYQSYLYPLLGARLSRMYSPKNKVIIDMGTGPGYLSIQLAKRTNAHVHAVDINPAMHEIAQEEAKKSGVSSLISFDLEDVHHLSYADQYADFIVSYSCLHHWEDVVKGLKECYRVLAPSGKIVILDTFNPQGSHLEIMRKQIKEPEYFRFVREAFEESYSFEDIHQFVQDAGIPNYSLETFHFLPEDFIESLDELEDAPLWEQNDQSADHEIESVTWMLTIEKEKEGAL
ncbi:MULTISPECIES: class I SAM-dependent methyltransferase [Bacillus]|nr:class I SAM-dependent methyltransferase [Bacillus subtilis]KDE25396.1 hypothetical protein EF83_00305 [Bacillus subtilis]MEC1875709.1 class I SAM-dependent methyltransferase [Bacillus subtilis]MEC1937616.1 class I SAM-dependent methyltransferase [Bacillus subtilis]MED5592520.1 class I SAM-dependent methyltransferase [Bacillus subtilis]QPF45682.1 methyltransferase domain-containing protein [Bacillus subtilis]